MLNILPYEIIPARFLPWSACYLEVAEQLIQTIRTDEIEVLHFGSTAAKVGGKGIIDLSILYPTGQLSKAVQHLAALGFQDQVSAQPFPVHRPRKDGAVIVKGVRYLIHAHVIELNSEEHHKQLAYKRYLLETPTAREQYENTKKQILSQGIEKQEAYGQQKAPFVKAILAQLN